MVSDAELIDLLKNEPTNFKRCEKLRSEICDWANGIFRGRAQFDSKDEAEFKAKIATILSDLENYQSITTTISIYLDYFNGLLKNWITPALSISPGPRVILDEKTSEEIRKNLEKL